MLAHLEAGGVPVSRASSGGGCDRDPAASLLLERDSHLVGRELERGRDVFSDPDGEGFAEARLVAVAVQVQLERLRLDTESLRRVPDRRDVHVRLTGDR